MRTLDIHRLRSDRWADFERVFGPRGAYGGCWCMWWRLTRSEFERHQGEGNRRAMRELVASGVVPGILGFAGGDAVAWCSVAPREQFGALNRSRVLRPIDDLPVWSIVCFHIARPERGAGLMERMIDGAIEHVRASGGGIVEAYPTRPRGRRLTPVSSFMGVPSAFERAGFVEVARPSASKLIMRRAVGEARHVHAS